MVKLMKCWKGNRQHLQSWAVTKLAYNIDLNFCQLLISPHCDSCLVTHSSPLNLVPEQDAFSLCTQDFFCIGESCFLEFVKKKLVTRIPFQKNGQAPIKDRIWRWACCWVSNLFTCTLRRHKPQKAINVISVGEMRFSLLIHVKFPEVCSYYTTSVSL